MSGSAHVRYRLFETLALDKEFLITCAGTSVFQHVLNGISWVHGPAGALKSAGLGEADGRRLSAQVLLTRGKATGIMDIAKFVFGGMAGTPLSGLSQFGKTFVMRLGFSWAWNWCTAQQLHMACFDTWAKPPPA